MARVGFHVDPKSSASGRVTDARSGPVDAIASHVSDADAATITSVRTDPTGSFHTYGTPPGIV